MANPGCILCKSSAAAPSFKRDGFDYFRCEQCGLVFIDYETANPREANKDLYGDTRSDFLVDPEHLSKHKRRSRRILRRFNTQGFSGRILEVGCREGFFLSVAKEEGWEAYGLDVEPQAAEIGRETWGLDIYCGPLDEGPYPERHFDVVYMSDVSDVMEHLLNPNEVLKCIWRMLRPGGLLYIKTGNIGSYTFRALGSAWYYLDFPIYGHVAFYCPESITYVLEKAGFRRGDVSVSTSGIHNARAVGPLWNRMYHTVLSPWAHLVRQGDNLRVSALRARE